ncbi:MAG TPA: patatin-like phospholipase family protein [Pyrinomonadaceae bacterium]|nr:patatin-like phospholipase family protein [Pyrinomonadaceae bacterium]
MPPYRIMTFDGGGVKGSLMATLVKRISDKFPDLLQQVDLYAGTSTGSVVALTLASGFSADTLVNFYSQDNLRSAFSPSRFNWFRPKYSNSNFRSLLESHFPGNPTIGDLKKHNLVAPTFKLDSPKKHDWCPVFTHNFPGSHHLNELVVDVALRSAAAPTVFPSHQGHIDGGMVANNPSTVAIAMALGHRKPRPALEDIRLLSVGTGLTPTIITLDTQGWGVVQWLLNPFRKPQNPLLNILFDGVCEADVSMSKHLLGAHSWRLNPLLAQQTELDDWKAIPQLVKTAEDYDLGPTCDWIEKNWN